MKLRKLKSRKPWHQLVIEEGTEAQFLACFQRLRFHRCYRCGALNLLRYGGSTTKCCCRDQTACLARADAKMSAIVAANRLPNDWWGDLNDGAQGH